MRIENLIQLKPEEEILEVAREDIVPHLPVFLLLFLWVVTPFFFLFPLFRLGLIGVLIFLALLLSALFVSARALKRWSRTVLIVTDRRVVDVEQRGLFDRVVTETPYTHVDEVSYRVKGVFPTLFRYGDLRLKLSGSAADIDFCRVRSPARLQDLINDLCVQTQSEVKDAREKKLKALADKLSPEEFKDLMGQVRKRERDEAISDVFSRSEDS